ncbi:MAG: PAS domain S-box protein [Sulfuricurvum sp.]|uniref:PAS domain S-box protein n=1 Tax=Sulfuricurvum sp. TaxID=2025608 RepID=UPI0026033B00|nr:PAS domain S-box protein [Sulfuricurvum sp.]MDD2829866.1 PAS domain S-box protein [Sulfuricurvum sp.]MDD4949221.1 PAS domain S-box protein [Sulfuricurvum sp.]
MNDINDIITPKKIDSNEAFIDWLRLHEVWLMEKILDYAAQHGYTSYTSTLLEAWRISIEGLTNSLGLLMQEYPIPPALGPSENYKDDPASAFGLLEAQRHRARGVNFAMFISLFKYYRQTYHDLIELHSSLFDDPKFYYEYVKQFFDRVEIAYSIEWHGRSSEEQIHDLSEHNRTLTNEKNLYLTIFDSFSSGAILLDSFGIILNYNQAASEILFDKKYHGGTYYYAQNKTVTTPEWIAEAISDLGDTDSYRFFYEQIRSQERYIYDVFIRPVDDVSGKFNGFILIMSDVTKLKSSQEQFELAMSATKDGLWDWNLVDNSVYFSPHWKAMVGYRDDELPNALQTWIDLVHPDDLASANEAIENSIHDPTIKYENLHRLHHKDGHYIWNLDRGVVQFNEYGIAVRMIGFHTDVSYVKSIEDKNYHLGMIVEEATTEIYIFDAQTFYFHYLNKSALKNTGYTMPEMTRLTPLDIKRMDIEELKNYMDEVKTHGCVSLHTYHYRKDGTSYPVNVTVQSTYYDDKPCYVAMASDMSEHEKMSNEIRDTQDLMIAQSRHAAMGEMIGMIAHQWRQPLSIVSMMVNNMLIDLEFDGLNIDECRTSGEGILSQVNFLSSTIDVFRDFFRPDKEKELVSIADIMDDAISMIDASLHSHDILLTLTDNSHAKVRVYPRELLQVFINLLKNSKEALISDGVTSRRITIVIEDIGDEVVTTICDNAGGIDPAIMGRIYDPYFSTKDEKTGTGLGLYMSKTIVEKHLGGTINAENKEDGVCFSIAFNINQSQSDEK